LLLPAFASTAFFCRDERVSDATILGSSANILVRVHYTL